MYLEGKITKQDYDKEMEDREEEGQSAEEEGNTTQGLEGDRLLAENENLLQGMKEAFSPDANNTITPADRLEMLRAAGLEQQLEQEKEKELQVSGV